MTIVNDFHVWHAHIPSLYGLKKRFGKAKHVWFSKKTERKPLTKSTFFLLQILVNLWFIFVHFFVTIMVYFTNLLIICKLFRVVIIYTWKKRAFFQIWNSRTPSLFNWLWTYFYKEIKNGGGCLPCKRQKIQWRIASDNWRRESRPKNLLFSNEK
jgi:hypothetical protein